MEHAYEKFGMLALEPLPMRPSEYIKRQVWATFLNDPASPRTYEMFGENKYMWGSDFPHQDSLLAEVARGHHEGLAGMSKKVSHKMVFENAAL
jgi:predicted TIM-barrel fold metal-dependent hydrolase